MPFAKESIQEQGLLLFLDSSRSKHNGFGYREFCNLVESKVNVANLMRAMNVKSEKTIKKWLVVYKEELDV
jgi:hypothetical protein